MSDHRMDQGVRDRVLALKMAGDALGEAAIVTFWTEDPYNLRAVVRALDDIEAKGARLRMSIEALQSRGEPVAQRRPNLIRELEEVPF